MDALSQGPCKQCRDEECCVHVVTRGQARKEMQHPVTEDGGNRNLVLNLKKTEDVGKRSTRGRKKTKEAATEDGKSSKSGRGDVCSETLEDAG